MTAVASRNGELEAALVSLSTSEANARQAAEQAQVQATAALGTAQVQLVAAQATIAEQATQIVDLELSATANALPTSTPTESPTSTATPTSTVTPPPTSTPVPPLYQADGSGGFEEWTVGNDWIFINGMLVNDGTSSSDTGYVPAPFDLEERTDYAVEAEIQWVREGAEHVANKGFGVVARASNRRAYWAGYNDFSCCGPGAFVGVGNSAGNAMYPGGVASAAYEVDNEWHTYRLEVKGNTIRLLIDGTVLIETVDNQVLQSGRVGLCADSQINVRSFKVIAL